MSRGLTLIALGKKHLKDLIWRGLSPDKLLSSNRRGSPNRLPGENAGKILWAKEKLSSDLVIINREVALEETTQS